MAEVVGVDLGPSPDSLTFYHDVLPLAQKHCTSCHTPGGIGPFSMASYDDAKAHAQVIHDYVQSGLMPPWKPSDGCRDLRDKRTLTPAEVDVFTGWAGGEAAAGDPADAPIAPPGTAGLPGVSVEMQMAAAYTPPNGESDHYQCFILDPKLAANADLIGYDVHPGDGAEVHHVLLYPANLSDAQALDDASPDEVGWTCFGGPGTPNPDTVGGWVPGSSAVLFPADTGIQLVAGQILIMQIHYNLSYTTPAPDQSTVQLQLASSPVSRHARVLPLANRTFSVPPGATGYAVDAQFTSPTAGTVWGVLPHAHTHAQAMHVDGDAGCMVDIPAWDFHWQQMYFFSDPMAITAQQSVSLRCTYDNPGAAPLTWGEKTSDEMCLNYFYVTQ
jgi:hypothetical protein